MKQKDLENLISQLPHPFGGAYGDARMPNWPHWHHTPLLGIATTGLRRDRSGWRFCGHAKLYQQGLGTFVQDDTVALLTCDNTEDHICGCCMVGHNGHCLGKVRTETSTEGRMHYGHRLNENNSDKSVRDALGSTNILNSGGVWSTDDSIPPRSPVIRAKEVWSRTNCLCLVKSHMA